MQAKLTENLNGHRARRTASQALLTGRLVDDRGHRMTPSVTIKHGVRYRYYVSCVMAQGRRAEAGSLARVSASEIERLVLDALRSRAGAQEHAGTQALDDASLVARGLERVTVHPKLLEIRFKARSETDADIAANSIVRLPWSRAHGPRWREIVGGAGADSVLRPLRAESRAKLLRAIAKARCWLEQLIAHEVTGTQSIAAAENVSERHVRTILTLAFLSPALVKAAIDGTLPRGMGLTRLLDLPSSWAEQHAILGLPQPQP